MVEKVLKIQKSVKMKKIKKIFHFFWILRTFFKKKFLKFILHAIISWESNKDDKKITLSKIYKIM